jgi:hypothetical protein
LQQVVVVVVVVVAAVVVVVVVVVVVTTFPVRFSKPLLPQCRRDALLQKILRREEKRRQEEHQGQVSACLTCLAPLLFPHMTCSHASSASHPSTGKATRRSTAFMPTSGA